MADDILNGGAPAPAPVPAAESGKGKKITCQFCESSLAPNGDVLAMSDKSRKLRDLEEENRKLVGINEELRGQIERLKAPPNPPVAEGDTKPKKSGFRL